jgi:hypothetical protein
MKYDHFYFFLTIIILFSACSKHYEEDIDPCDNPYPQATEINNVTFKKSNSDTLQHLNIGEVNEPSYSIGYRYHIYNSEKTRINIRYNTYDSHDPEFYHIEPLFNGAVSFEISIKLKDSTLSNLYELDHLSINFMNGYYYYESTYDSNTTINISKYGELWDKIEGSFTSTCINYNNNADTLIIDCQFSAVRWCDQ